MASNSEVGGSADYETLVSTSDVELLKRAWRNEKAAPEILQYEGSLVERAKEQIELVLTSHVLQDETLEDCGPGSDRFRTTLEGFVGQLWKDL